MTTPLSNDWLDARITATANLIEQYEAGILALSTGAMSYTIDTGQTKQTVTKQQIHLLQATLERLESRLTAYHVRRYGGATHGVPGW